MIRFCLGGNFIRIIVAILFFLLARFSKENAIVIIAILPVLLYYLKIDFKKILLSFGVSLLSIGLYMFIKRNLIEIPGVREYEFFENPLYFGSSILDRLSIGFYCSWFYLKMLIYPKYLSFYYGYNQIPMANFSFWQVWASVLFYLPVGAYGVYLFIKRKLLGLGLVLWFGVMLGVINVFFPIVGIVADRFTYIFSLGFCIVLAWILFKVFKVPTEKVGNNIRISLPFLIAFFFVLIIYSTRVVVRNNDWHDHLSLYDNDINTLNNPLKHTP
tara:strand:+ start:1719 stop:2534 length:816 start_codon:yes stop_codon:yes gene_type:complete